MKKRIVVTGAAGMIGSNIISGLNENGYDDVVAVDDLTNGHKFLNLVGMKISDYIDKLDFLESLANDRLGKIDCVFHQGACSTTTEWDGKYMMHNNYEYTKKLYHMCVEKRIRFLYASSAAVYGDGVRGFSVSPECENPLNVYGYSKWLFDYYLLQQAPPSTQVVGLRYFNVYGPNEQHKGSMASVAWHLYNQHMRGEKLKLFGSWDGFAAGEQMRDFIYVKDVVAVNLWLLENPEVTGVVNCGSGQAETFNSVANAIIDYYQCGEIEYIDFPDHLKKAYQSYTQADMGRLYELGYKKDFYSVSDGVTDYLNCL